MAMTEDERKTRMTQRNTAICMYYTEGHKLSECASRFKLGRQRVLQILQNAGVWKPYVKGDRTKFLGISVSEEQKAALQREAVRRGISMSALTADLIKDMLATVQAEGAQP